MKILPLLIFLPALSGGAPIPRSDDPSAWILANGRPAAIPESACRHEGITLKNSKDLPRQEGTASAAKARNAGKLAGERDSLKIVVQNTNIEHRLHGAPIVKDDTAPPGFDVAVAASKFAKIPDFGKNGEGHTLIQDHGAPVWFRSITIKTP